MRSVKVLSLFIGLVIGECIRPAQRKEITTLTPNELSKFKNAFRALHSGGRFTKIDGYAALHQEWSSEGHGNPQFLPWHRQYIRNIEKDLQAIDPEVVLPYWDWTRDSGRPHESIIFTDRYMGGNGVGRDMCVRDGMSANWSMAVPRRHCLARDFDLGNRISSFASRAVIESLFDIRDYTEFYETLEVAHGAIHLNIGGERGDLTPMWSPNDPIFFLHHVFVDMIWWNWQRYNGQNNYSGLKRNRRVSTRDYLDPFDVRVSSLTSTTRSDEHCYIYPRYPRITFDSNPTTSPPSGASLADVNSKQNVAPQLEYIPPSSPGNPKPLPDSFITMQNLDKAKVQRIEAKFRSINQRPSPALFL